MRRFIFNLKTTVFKDGSYKFIALIVSIVLWSVIFGRRDFVLNHKVDLNILLAPNHIITNRMVKQVSLKLSGPRQALEKYVKSPESISLNLVDSQTGQKVVSIKKSSVTLPVGVQVLSIKPSWIQVNIRETSKKGGAFERDSST